MILRTAQPDDAAAVQGAYRQIKSHLAQTVDYRHWHTEGHPTPEMITDWIEEGNLYIAESGTDVAGVMVLDHETGEGYDTAAWSVEAGEGQALIVHALGVSPLFQGRGVAGFLIDSAVRIAQERGCVAVRLDVLVDNIPARSLYARHGFRDLGLHTIDYPTTDLNQFHLFERVL